MDERKDSAPTANNRTTIESNGRELVVRRTFDAPARIVFKAWATPDLFLRWWTPKSMGLPLFSCEMDVRVGGGYSLTFGHDAESGMTFFGKYTDVVPNVRLVWTNEEDEEDAVTTVTFEEKAGKTLLTFRELHPAKDASGEFEGGILPEQLDQLDELLATLEA